MHLPKHVSGRLRPVFAHGRITHGRISNSPVNLLTSLDDIFLFIFSDEDVIDIKIN